jgi:hypothetical protein
MSQSAGFHERIEDQSSQQPAPPFERIAFKEWAVVCDSIARGETSLIFRKGGLAEGRDGFHFKFSRFFLFPTFFHEQIESTRLKLDGIRQSHPDSVVISLFLEIELNRWITDLRLLSDLEEFHILQSSVLRERFNYDERKGLHVAFIRAYRLYPLWQFPFHRSYGGCRSWIELPEAPKDLRADPVLDFAEIQRRRAIVESALNSVHYMYKSCNR